MATGHQKVIKWRFKRKREKKILRATSLNVSITIKNYQNVEKFWVVGP